MNARERWLAALDMQPVDRLPFWPKLNSTYARLNGAPSGDRALPDLHAWIGSDELSWIRPCTREVRADTEQVSSQENGRQITSYRTPIGELHAASKLEPVSGAAHPVEYPVKTVEDVKVLTAFYQDAKIELNEDAAAEMVALARSPGRTTAVGCTIASTPIMAWVQHLAGPENCHYLLLEHPAEVKAFFEVMHSRSRRQFEILCAHCPADFFMFNENTSTTLISPAQYRAHSYPYIKEMADLARVAGKRVVLHMCGHLKALLPDLATLHVSGFEAYTTPPVGNATLFDARSICTDTCFIGGTNAALWLRPTHEIIVDLEKELAALPHHRGLVITSAGVMPPAVKPETVKEVCAWVHGYKTGLGIRD